MLLSRGQERHQTRRLSKRFDIKCTTLAIDSPGTKHNQFRCGRYRNQHTFQFSYNIRNGILHKRMNLSLWQTQCAKVDFLRKRRYTEDEE